MLRAPRLWWRLCRPGTRTHTLTAPRPHLSAPSRWSRTTRPGTGPARRPRPGEPRGLTAVSADWLQKIRAEPPGMSTPPLHRVSDTLPMPSAKNPEPTGPPQAQPASPCASPERRVQHGGTGAAAPWHRTRHVTLCARRPNSDLSLAAPGRAPRSGDTPWKTTNKV